MADVVRHFPAERVPHELEGPRPLARLVEDAEPFPVHALGPLASAAEAIAEHTRAPIAICAQAVLGAVALIGQAHADVVLPTGQAKPTSLFLVTIAGSGERKSAVDRLGLQAVYDHEQQLRDGHKRDMSEYEIKKAVWTAERERSQAELRQAKKKQRLEQCGAEADLRALGAEPLPPLTPILVCPDPTFEGYFRLTAEGHPALGLFSAEGGSFIGGYGMSADQKLKTAASVSSVWDGEPLKRVRAGDGSRVLAGRRLSLHLMAQPDVADLMLNDDLLINQGLLSRVLAVAPASTAGTRFFAPPSEAAKEGLRRYCGRIEKMLQVPIPLRPNTRNELEPRRLHLSSEAMDIWIRKHDYIEELLAPNAELSLIPGLANKAPEHAARLAAVMTLYTDISATHIDGETLANACELMRHYLNENLRLKASAHFNPDLRLAGRVWEWIQRQWEEPAIYPAAIYNDCTIREVRERQKALRIIRILQDHNYLSRVGEGMRINGSIRREAWLIHGRILK